MGSVQPISQLIQQPTAASQMPGTQTNSAGSNVIGPNGFLQLLTTEMMNQDPTSPQDPTQSVTQLAQFSALQYQQQLTGAFQGFESNFGVMQTASLIGKQVTVAAQNPDGSSSSVAGTINGIVVQNGQPYFTMVDANGKQIFDANGNGLFSTAQIVAFGTPGGTGSGTGGSGGSGSSGGAGGSGS